MKKLAILAALLSLPLFAVGCDNSPAAREGAAEKKEIKAEGDQMKDDINAAAKEDKAAVDDAVKDADADVDADTKAAEGK